METLSQLLSTAMSEIGFQTLNEYFSNTRQEAKQLTSIANRELNTLKKDDWQELRTTLPLEMTAATQYPLPSDFRQFTPDTAWSNTRRVDFPVSSEAWLYYEASNISTGLKQRMRLADGQIEISNPQPGETLLIEYISDSPVRSNGGVPKPKFTQDSDTLILNNDLFIMGVVWRFMKVKGLDWEPNFAEYRSMYKRERGTNSGSQTINTAGDQYQGPYLPTANLWV